MALLASPAVSSFSSGQTGCAPSPASLPHPMDTISWVSLFPFQPLSGAVWHAWVRSNYLEYLLCDFAIPLIRASYARCLVPSAGRGRGPPGRSGSRRSAGRGGRGIVRSAPGTPTLPRRAPGAERNPGQGSLALLNRWVTVSTLSQTGQFVTATQPGSEAQSDAVFRSTAAGDCVSRGSGSSPSHGREGDDGGPGGGGGVHEEEAGRGVAGCSGSRRLDPTPASSYRS
jgi:hypothetical protein